MEEEEVTRKNHEDIVTFEFPIRYPGGTKQINKIPPYALPKLHGLSNKDPDAFVFEFDEICRCYDYSTTAQKLNFFPATLKGASLRWFMGLGEDIIQTWDEIKKLFLKKYQDYCKGR